MNREVEPARRNYAPLRLMIAATITVIAFLGCAAIIATGAVP